MSYRLQKPPESVHATLNLMSEAVLHLAAIEQVLTGASPVLGALHGGRCSSKIAVADWA